MVIPNRLVDEMPFLLDEKIKTSGILLLPDV
jgi:hypothetical protein